MSKKVGELGGTDSHVKLCMYLRCLFGHINKEMKSYCKMGSTIC